MVTRWLRRKQRQEAQRNLRPTNVGQRFHEDDIEDLRGIHDAILRVVGPLRVAALKGRRGIEEEAGARFDDSLAQDVQDAHLALETALKLIDQVGQQYASGSPGTKRKDADRIHLARRVQRVTDEYDDDCAVIGLDGGVEIWVDEDAGTLRVGVYRYDPMHPERDPERLGWTEVHPLMNWSSR